ncbi:hypothetical protein Desor_0861 [Desulfosporosinus orientis DSM 765]|uniref:Uncharacterized protein n=1 Tax=Desulfosporosinus orientis (strain ATCC 19365 / DSM 765 / NCIMB 8382 / VKM B-1628 / Singapore I) TaxID=768706 RepID=G7WCK4_DESOD|nr:hypothetical protein [Desulfosporosinus orientis]AET66542.1 hypothetical protein Desor_0861 [Desulfosporosinus orientis DSM 765]
MALDFKVLHKVKGNPSAEVAPGRRLKINPGQDYVYDLPKELIFAVNKEYSLENLFTSDNLSEDFLLKQGQEFMSLLIRNADSDPYRDRTADMIERVAQQTGMRFPHVFERYVELAILALRPHDAWTISEATTKVLKVRSFNCSLGKKFAEKGINNCQAFCRAVYQAAAEKAGTTAEMGCKYDLDNSGLCEFTFQKV